MREDNSIAHLSPSQCLVLNRTLPRSTPYPLHYHTPAPAASDTSQPGYVTSSLAVRGSQSRHHRRHAPAPASAPTSRHQHASAPVTVPPIPNPGRAHHPHTPHDVPCTSTVPRPRPSPPPSPPIISTTTHSTASTPYPAPCTQRACSSSQRRPIRGRRTRAITSAASPRPPPPQPALPTLPRPPSCRRAIPHRARLPCAPLPVRDPVPASWPGASRRPCTGTQP